MFMLSDEQTHSVLWDHSLIPIGPGVGQGEHRPPEGILDTRGFSPLATCSRVFSLQMNLSTWAQPVPI